MLHSTLRKIAIQREVQVALDQYAEARRDTFGPGYDDRITRAESAVVLAVLNASAKMKGE